MLPYVQNASTLLFIASRGWQIAANVSQRSTGQLAFLTLFMNAGGSAARIFTSSQEVKQVRSRVSAAACVHDCKTVSPLRMTSMQCIGLHFSVPP